MILRSELNQLRNAISLCNMQNNHVSLSPIGWHIDHSLKTICSICEQLRESNPTDFKWRFNITRNYIFIRGSIPRAKERDPIVIHPEEELCQRQLVDLLTKTEEILSTIEELPKNSFFKHSYFGELNLKRALYYLQLHTAQHLKIIDEIEYACIYSEESVESEVH